MSYQNFKPEVFAEIIDRELKKNLVFGNLANRDYEGSISQEGDSVKIASITSVTVQDYTGADIDFEEDAGAEQIIPINKAKAFGLVMDDVDAAQAKGGLGVLDLRTQNAVYKMADEVDKALAALYTKAKTTVAVDLATDKIIEKIVDLGAQMDLANVPTQGRWLVVDPLTYAAIVKAMPTISTGENTFGVAATNYVGQYAGFSIYRSNNVVAVANVRHCIAGVTAGMTLAMQLSKVAAGSFEKSFKEYVKGLNLFGCDVLETETGKSALIADLAVTVTP